jgi:hypothetical protein
MLNFTETKTFGVSCVGLGALGTSYLAGMDDWRLIALPLLGMFAYFFFFREARDKEGLGRD